MADKFVDFLGVYDHAMPRENFIQHIPEMLHIKFEGNTFGDLIKAAEEKYKEDEEIWPLLDDFFSYNREEGAEDSSELFEKDEKDAVAHFAVFTNK